MLEVPFVGFSLGFSEVGVDEITVSMAAGDMLIKFERGVKVDEYLKVDSQSRYASRPWKARLRDWQVRPAGVGAAS